MRQARWACIGMVSAALLSAPALACGYHNPSDVARGVMNFIYPNSLYVRSAVWRAQKSGLLPPRRVRRAKDLFAYQRTAANLEALGRRLAPLERAPSGFSVVLLDTMLWARFVPGPRNFRAKVHVNGPEAGDAVVVTEAPVIASLLDGRLDVARAEEAGLIRLYGSAERTISLRDTLAGFDVPARQSVPSASQLQGEAG